MNSKIKSILNRCLVLAEEDKELTNDIQEYIKVLDNPHKTPDAIWRVHGEADPHNDRYDCVRSDLILGKLTDDEIANAVYMFGNNWRPPLESLIAGTAFSSEVYLTAAKDRIRWLSRQLAKAQESV